MSTETQSPKVQQGPNLRAAIAELPKEASSRICRDKLEGKSVGEVASAINDRLVNDLVNYMNVIMGATHAWKIGESDSLRVGLYVLCDDLQDEFRRIGYLMNALWRDENGMEVKS